MNASTQIAKKTFKLTKLNRTMASYLILSTSALAITFHHTAYANVTAQPAMPNAITTNHMASAEGNDKYDAGYFMAFEPQTLYDILEDIPGANPVLISTLQASQNRGFGSAGDQILINSKRVSGKENSLEEELNAIQAKDVDYVELIRGTRSDLDVQSKGLVVNVVLKKQIESSILWSVGTRKTADIESLPEASLVYSAGNNDVKYRVGLSHLTNPTKLTYVDLYTSPNGIETDTYSRTRYNKYREDKATGKLEYFASDDTTLLLNASLLKIYVDANYKINHNDWISNQIDERKVVYDWEMNKWEISGDLTHKYDADNQLKLLFISNRADANDQIWGTLLPINEQPIADYQLPRLYVSKENVLRGNWKHQVDSRHAFDSGLEVAINNRDEDLQFIRQSGDKYHTTEINEIKETRYEAFVNYNFAISSALNLQSSIIYERSTMSVGTDFSLLTDAIDKVENQSSRTFSYVKPRANLRYDWNDNHQLRFNYERTVKQLALNDFVPEFNREERRLEETNPNLKPEMRDELSISIEKQLLDTNGSITLTPYYHRISDLITEIPLETYSGDGNVDSGKEYGLTIDTNFDLAALGLNNTLVSASYTLRDSEMTHPFTHENVPIASLSDRKWNLKINQNELLPGLSFSLTMDNQSPYEFYRYDYQGTLKNEVKAGATFDYQINKHFKLRLKGSNLLKYKSGYDRTRHTGLFTSTDALRQEQRNYHRAPRFSLILSGQL